MYSESPLSNSEEVRQLASQAAETDSPIAYAMLGDLIQLLDDEAEFGLADAEAAYQRAIQLDPGYADAHLSLGYFYEAVMADPERARAYFERAIALGDSEANDALAALLREACG